MTDVPLITFIGGIVIMAAITDIRSQRIPNVLTFSTMAFALFCHAEGGGLQGFLFSLAGVALGIALFILPYLMGGMGAGDVKLLGAVGAVLGPWGVFEAALCTALIGGVYALVLLLLKFKDCKGLIARYAITLKIFAATGELAAIPAGENEKQPKLCYGVAIALGTLGTIYLHMTNSSIITLFF